MSLSSRRALLGTLGATIVSPGLINTHAHLYRYAYPISVDPEVVGFPAGVTATPSQMFTFPEKHGTLETGVTADLTVIDRQEGNFELIDQQNDKRAAKRKIVPVAAIHGGTVVRLDPTVHEAVPHAGVRV